MTPKLENFIKTGSKPLSTRERAALLDEARSVLTAEVTAWTPPSTAEQLDRIERASKVNKTTQEKAHELLAAKVREQRSKLQARGIGKPAAKPAPAKPAAAPTNIFVDASTATIACLLHRKLTPDREAALAELVRRGVIYDETTGIYSQRD
jgi:hypothetical protein